MSVIDRSNEIGQNLCVKSANLIHIGQGNEKWNNIWKIPKNSLVFIEANEMRAATVRSGQTEKKVINHVWHKCYRIAMG